MGDFVKKEPCLDGHRPLYNMLDDYSDSKEYNGNMEIGNNESMKKAVKTYAQKVSMAAMGENAERRVSRICNLMYNEYIKGQRDFAKKLLEKLDDKTKGYDDEFYKGYDTGVDDSIAIIKKMMKEIDEKEATPYPGEGSMWK